MLVAKGAIVEVFWKGRKVTNTPPFQGNGFLGVGNEHIELDIQRHLDSIVISI
jgi:hypothetical protein